MQRQPKGADHLENRVETWATFTGKRLVQALTGKACIAGDLGHALCTGYISESLGNERRITIRLLEARLKIGGHLLWGTEMFCNVITTGSDFSHVDCSERALAKRKAVLMSLACVLVSAREEDDQLASPLLEVHPISRPKMDSQFGDTFTYRLDVARVACRQSLDSGLNPCACPGVAQ